MAVVLRVEQTFPDGSRHVVPRLYPSGQLVSREERERAEALDAFLAERIPKIALELEASGLFGSAAIEKWHALGKRLQFVDDQELVLPNDRDSGAVWLAIRQYAPPGLLPRGEEKLTPARMSVTLQNLENERRLGKKHDHFERCYKLGKFNIDDVNWLTWSDFDSYVESPGLERDPRILHLLRHEAARRRRPFSRGEFRRLCKNLRDLIPTKSRQRDTSSLSEQDLKGILQEAFKASQLEEAL